MENIVAAARRKQVKTNLIKMHGAERGYALYREWLDQEAELYPPQRSESMETKRKAAARRK